MNTPNDNTDSSRQYIAPQYNNAQYDQYAEAWKRDNRNNRNKAPWAWVTYVKNDGTRITRRARVYLHCHAGEMMIDKKGRRRFFTGPQADSRLSYVLCK